jgi:hypothetical protein
MRRARRSIGRDLTSSIVQNAYFWNIARIGAPVGAMCSFYPLIALIIQ